RSDNEIDLGLLVERTHQLADDIVPPGAVHLGGDDQLSERRIDAGLERTAAALVARQRQHPHLAVLALDRAACELQRPVARAVVDQNESPAAIAELPAQAAQHPPGRRLDDRLFIIEGADDRNTRSSHYEPSRKPRRRGQVPPERRRRATITMFRWRSLLVCRRNRLSQARRAAWLSRFTAPKRGRIRVSA